MEHLQSPFTQYQLKLPKIIISKVSEKPPWAYSHTQIGLHKEKKKCTESFNDLVEYPEKHIYTDGSETNQHVGFDAVSKQYV